MDVDALRALMLQMEWGADEALDEEPVGRLTPATPAPSGLAEAPSPPASVSAPTGSAKLPAGGAGPDLRDASTMEALRAAIAGFEGCALRDTATGAVLAEGDASSGLLVIYGPPSDDDDRARRPLSGKAGQFFDAMLTSIGLDRTSVAIAPLVPWRPPGGRPPSPAELARCVPFLHRLIAITRPRLVLLMGTQAARTILGPERRVRGQLLRADIPGLDEAAVCIALAAPDELLRSPENRGGAWAALRRAKRMLQSSTPNRE